MSVNPESPVYPVHSIDNSVGVNKREYFAAYALQGLLAGGQPVETAAHLAIKLADALIRELNIQEDADTLVRELDKQHKG
ncbi:MAG: hypothetical protein JOZ78_11320 [Chroococcidiopsidaceae cyanobacterium CP_BM_ER_R8_30]|nr:hypothetical protein [Chroococcidiopsidaceae cyanobacterium CP_BM_ER_R8_30]